MKTRTIKRKGINGETINFTYAPWLNGKLTLGPNLRRQFEEDNERIRKWTKLPWENESKPNENYNLEL